MKTYHAANQGVDTLILTIKGKMPDDLTDELHHYQDIAKGKETNILTVWEFAGVRGPGSRMVVGMGGSAVYLHRHYIETLLHSIFSFLVDFLGYEPDWQVSEVHQCADIAGWAIASRADFAS